ncbi:MAG TPA: hypothetical protein VN132_03825 [Bdellovibrio sp.]|nr:hypothetical protein [Bdellovibrio sp.]
MKTSYKKILIIAAVIASSSAAMSQQSDQSREEMRAAFAACAESVGLQKPEAGQRPQAPTDEQRQKMDTCLKEKGFDPPRHMGGHPHGPPPESDQGAGGIQ